MQLVPHVSATTAGTQSREPKRGVVLVSKSLELVELADVLPGADHRDLRVLEACCLQVAQRAKRHVVGAGATHIVIDVSSRAIERDLHRSEEHTSELQSLMRISYAVFCLTKKHS